MLNGSNLNNAVKFAVAGENIEIIKLCEQSHSFSQESKEISILFHWNDVFKYIYGYENKVHDIIDQRSTTESKTFFRALNQLHHRSASILSSEKISSALGLFCISSSNYELFSFFYGEGMKIDESIIKETVKNGNLFLFTHFLEQESIDINFKDIFFRSFNVSK